MAKRNLESEAPNSSSNKNRKFNNDKEIDPNELQQFFQACRKGDLGIVKMFNNKYKDIINSVDEENSTPLHIACQEGYAHLGKFLIINGAKLDAINKDKEIPLHSLARFADLKNEDQCLEIAYKINFLEWWASDNNMSTLVNWSNSFGATPLHEASYSNYCKIAKFFVENKADINAVDARGRIPLQDACHVGYINIVKFLVENKADINAVDYGGRTPLHQTCFEGDLEIFEFLVKSGAEINKKDLKETTPIMEVFHRVRNAQKEDQDNSLKIIKFLMKNKASLQDAPNGSTLLHSACQDGKNIELVKLLLENKAQINAATNNNATPLHYWCNLTIHYKQRKVEILEILIKNGANLEAATKDGKTPLDLAFPLALIRNEIHILEILLKNGAKANFITPAEGQQLPLICAIEYSNFEFVKFLIDYKADVKAIESAEQTPLHMICLKKMTGWQEIVKLLIDNKADVNTVDKNNNTPLHFVCHTNNFTEESIDENSDEEDNKSSNIYDEVDLSLIKFLIENKADTNAINYEKKLPGQCITKLPPDLGFQINNLCSLSEMAYTETKYLLMLRKNPSTLVSLLPRPLIFHILDFIRKSHLLDFLDKLQPRGIEYECDLLSEVEVGEIDFLYIPTSTKLNGEIVTDWVWDL